MLDVTLNLSSEKTTPKASCYELGDGRQFFALSLTPNASIILPSFDLEAIDYAERLASELQRVVAELRAKLPVQEPFAAPRVETTTAMDYVPRPGEDSAPRVEAETPEFGKLETGQGRY